MEDKLLVALLGKIQDVLSGENTVIGNESDYLAWCLPGIPFQAEDLQFAIKGLNGADGVETAQLNRNAFEFSRVANNIPDDGIINGYLISTELYYGMFIRMCFVFQRCQRII